MTILRLIPSASLLRASRTPQVLLARNVRYMGKGSHGHGGDPDVIAREKARNLSGTQDSSAPHKEHAPGWNEHLASDSEAAVKADQAVPAGKPGKELQDKTVKHTHEHHHTDAGHKGAEHHQAKHAKVETASEEAVKADRGDH